MPDTRMFGLGEVGSRISRYGRKVERWAKIGGGILEAAALARIDELARASVKRIGGAK